MEAGRFPGAMTTTSVGVQHAPPLSCCCLVGVWVDRGLYSGCGVLLFVVVLLPERWLGACLVLAN